MIRCSMPFRVGTWGNVRHLQYTYTFFGLDNTTYTNSIGGTIAYVSRTMLDFYKKSTTVISEMDTSVYKL